MSTDLASRYATAEQLITANQKKLIHRPMVAPAWIRNTETFWYRNRIATGAEYVFVDAAAGTKRAAFDHDRLAKALGALLDAEYEPNALPFFGIDLRDDSTVRFAVGTKRVEVSLETYTAQVIGEAHADEMPSPDGKWSVGRNDHNLFIRNVATDEIRVLTTDGEDDLAYAVAPGGSRNQTTQDNIGFTTPPMVAWAPDSSKFVTYRLDERLCSQMHLVRSAPLDGGRPQVYTYRYSMVGDGHVATAEYVVFDAATGQATKAKCDPVDMAYVSSVALGFVWWNKASDRLFFITGDRGDKNVWINEFVLASGDVIELAHESSPDQVLLGPQLSDRFVRILETGEILIWSERSGWGHLYVIGSDGEWKALTSGEWLVRKLIGVDEDARRVVFSAGGFDPDADPYVQELYSVSLDGGDVTTITADGLDHECFPSKSGKFFVDNASRVDVPNVATLRNFAGDVVLELETADASALYDLGFNPCERVKVKAADGVTDIWAGVYKPFGFDETKTYPVLEEIYPGPQINTVPMRFPQSGGVMTGAPRAFEMLGLGFVVVTVDGAGSALRSQAFSNDARHNGRGNLIPDHVTAIKQLATTRPWMDIERMGVYGHSGGGYASTRAILQEPDFYKVCVSSAGDHDDHTYHAWWGEKYFGLEDEHDYDDASNATLAANLKGKLLLGHGEMDDNVTPHLTMRLVDALIKANKNFDLKIVPNADHSMFHNLAWWSRQRWDYFVTHLLGEEPPEYQVADIPFDAEMLAAMMGGKPAMTDLLARYERTEKVLDHNLKKLIDIPRVNAVWIKDTDTFWYRKTAKDASEFVLVDADARTKQPAFDHERMAKTLSVLKDEEYKAETLPFFSIEFRPDNKLRFALVTDNVEVDLETYEAKIVGPVNMTEALSPDGKWAVSLRDFNLIVRNTQTDEERILTTDGEKDFTYGGMNDSCASTVLLTHIGVTEVPPLVVWSHDSSKFVTHRLDQRGVELMHIVRSSPLDGSRPQVMSYRYPIVGDEVLPTSDLFVFNPATGMQTKANTEPLLTPFVPTIGYGFLWWSDDDSKLFWLWGNRGDKTCRLHEYDVAAGDLAIRYEESAKTHVLYGPQQQDRNVRVLTTGEILWWSQRTDWGHLYLVSPGGGQERREKALTSGDWFVRKVAVVDEANRRVVFAGAGREPGSDLYMQAIYSVDLDSGEITAVTADGLDHEFTPSPTNNYFVDNTSRYDTPNVAVLRDRAGAVVLELEQSDASALYEIGWQPADRVVVKAADGVTDIYCAIYKPFDFDETKKYPIVDEIYAGPQVSITPQRFPMSGGTLTAERSGAHFASLGFVCVAVDHRGSGLREKTFQDHNRLVADGDYVHDHVAAIKQLAKTRPWMDLDRVGITGHSGGGLGSTRAILSAPEFFKVAVSTAGDHDDAIYHAWWGEKYWGLKDEFDYVPHANASLAANLKGKLLLIHGDMDDNVTPHHTMRLVDALVSADVDFDLLIVPNGEHSIMNNKHHWVRRRWDYFVEHLMGETKPDYKLSPIPLDPETLAVMLGR